MMEELIQLINQYDPSFHRQIRGAASGEIQQLEALVHRELPTAYREFLESMGRDMGGIGFADIDFSIGTVIRFYEDPRFAHPERYLFVAAHEQDPYSDLYLDLATLQGADCAVVSFESSEEEPASGVIHRFHKRLKDMLFSNAFLCKRAGALAYNISLTASPDRRQGERFDPYAALTSIEQVAGKLGFRRIPGTSPEYLLMDRKDAAIFAQSYESPQFLIAAQDEREVARLHSIVSDHTALV